MLRLGNTNIRSVFLGDQKIIRGYVGNNLVFGEKVHKIEYLTFTAEEPSTTIALSGVGDPNPIALEYMTNDSTWAPYTINTSITLAQVGDKIRFRGNNDHFSKDSKNYYRFVKNDKKIAVSGSVMTLLDNTDKLRDLTGKDWCFFKLFENFRFMMTAPELPATSLADNCYNSMFFGGGGFEQAPELPAKTLAKNCYNSMFYFSFNLKKIKVRFTDWGLNNNYGTRGWLDTAFPEGVFMCPAELPDIRGGSNIPDLWQVIRV